ncbi:hypothetical protein E1265_31755 [Streptomyces sp. 8K308]|uniref:hypothetical protein n=1 Tax=Streptomyces sp. 8K308 TaxID=2530388 RepID=UPI00104E8C6E|nr:hypothetical protein [Streptomyces sp. 8K308]TDC10018.1 hypothetical protein E1265_31755 [Streptomyces sp. 8K308]
MRLIWTLLAIVTGVLCALFVHSAVVDLFDTEMLAATVGALLAALSGAVARSSWHRGSPITAGRH